MGRSFGCTNTGLSVPAGLVGQGELAEISADHVELDFNVVKGLAVVDCHIVADHFWEDDGIAEVGLDWDGLLSGLGILLALLALGIEADVFVLDLCIAMGKYFLRTFYACGHGRARLLFPGRAR